MNIKGQKGAAMMLTLIVVLVLSILGTALWQYGMTSTIQVDKEVKKKQADYIARSGAEAVAAYILNTSDPIEMKDYLDNVDGKLSEPVTLGDGSFQVQISRDDRKVIIQSTGTVQEQTSTTSIVLNESVVSSFPSEIFSNVMFSTSDIILNGSPSIIGNIESTGTVTINGLSDPVYIEHSNKQYLPVSYPIHSSTDTLTIENNDTEIISSEAQYSSIHVKNGGTLNFQLPGSDMTVIIDSLDVDGTLTITGSGRLYLYTNNFTGSGSGCEVNVNSALPLSSFFVLMPPGGICDVSRFWGLFYGPGADMTLNGGPSFKGAMIAGEIRNSGNPIVTYWDDAKNISSDIFDGVNLPPMETSYEYRKIKWN